MSALILQGFDQCRQQSLVTGGQRGNTDGVHIVFDGLTRSPTVSCPPVIASITAGWRLRISVRGPGQKASARRCALSGMSIAQRESCAACGRWTISGWSAGRPLAANIFATASALLASIRNANGLLLDFHDAYGAYLFFAEDVAFRRWISGGIEFGAGFQGRYP